RPRSGTYLKPEGHRRLNNQSLMLVTMGFESELARRFVSLGIQEARKRGWEPHVVQMERMKDRVLIQALNSGELALILSAPDALTPEIVQALQDAKGRAVLVGNRLDAMGISSIVADDAQGVRLAMKHLQSCGHEHIGVLSSNWGYAIDQIQIATWKSCMSGVSFCEEDYVLSVEPSRFDSPLEQAYLKMRQWLKHRPPQITAMLCLIDQSLPAVIRAIIDEGLQVPGDISLVSFGNTAVSRYANPAVTSVDPHLALHVQKGVALINNALSANQDESVQGQLIQIDPELVVRDSVSQASLCR
ncbi:MAG: substrate-binding domain-containing protein, partial [Phycisphaeraceae bacterium]|nr:substrate-binding domain-containing protein [Phycisphaeraceae bacterium]